MLFTHEAPPAALIRLASVEEVLLCRVGAAEDRPGNWFWLAEGADAEPQDAVLDAVERDDWAVEDFSFRTRDVLFGGAGVGVGVEEVT